MEHHVPNFQMAKGHDESSLKGVAGRTALPRSLRRAKGLRENSSSRRQKGSYLEFLKSHLPVSRNAPRFPFRPPFFDPATTLSGRIPSFQISFVISGVSCVSCLFFLTPASCFFFSWIRSLYPVETLTGVDRTSEGEIFLNRKWG